MNRLATDIASSRHLAMPATLLCLVLASAVWIESDAYRYAGGVMLVVALVDYFRTPPSARVDFGWIGWACFGWTAYVATRYAWELAVGPSGSRGSAEGLYLFPVAFSTLGYAFYRFRAHLRRLPELFMATSLVMLATTIDFATVISAQRAPFLYQNNTIHASVAAGLIAIVALAYVEHASRNATRHDVRQTTLRILLGLTVLALCLTGIFGAKSKGVWLALGIALPLQALTMIVTLPRSRALVAAAIAVAAAALGGFAAFGTMAQEISPPAASALVLLDTAILHEEGVAAIHELIRSGSVPFSFQERLMLWTNALEVFLRHPLFGAGIGWHDAWLATTYADISYNLMHNGYVEIVVRYGLTGLVFFCCLYAAFLAVVLGAWRQRLISAQAAKIWLFSLVFFAGTLLTNSNNRLAIGESYILISAGFAFCCLYLRQHAIRPAIR